MFGMPVEFWLDLLQRGGAILSPFLAYALLWMTGDRNRLLTRLEEKSTKVEDMAERMIVVMTEVKGLFSGRRTKV
jgi:hypothetical protein